MTDDQGVIILTRSSKISPTVDPLTGLYNRRFMDETLEREVARAQRKQARLVVCGEVAVPAIP